MRVVLQRLLSKPEALRIACEYAKSNTQVPSPDQSGNLRADGDDNSNYTIGTYARLLKCRCKPRRRLKSTTRNFGPLFFTQGTDTPRAHSPSCPHAAWNNEQSFWSVGLSTNIFRKILSTAVTVTLMSSTGAGGCGMSPEHFTYRPIHPRSPAFQIIDIWLQKGSDPNGEISDKVMKSLQWLFTQKKASPYDLDENGGTILHYVYCSDTKTWPENYPKILLLTEFLIAVGVPNCFSLNTR